MTPRVIEHIPVNVGRDRQPAPEAGFFGCNSDELAQRHARFTQEEKWEHKWWVKQQQSRREAPPVTAGTDRLVYTRKSPTTENSGTDRRETGADRPAILRFYGREWSGEQRVRVETLGRHMAAPAPQLGDRWTEKLTDRAARAITDSGAYVATCRRGFSTFLTLTFDTAARRRILDIQAWRNNASGKKGDKCGAVMASGKFSWVYGVGDMCSGHEAAGPFTPVDFDTESTIGREVSRFFDLMQKRYQRGWTWTPSKDEREQAQGEMFAAPVKFGPTWDVKHTDYGPERVPAPLDYIWVAEAPPKYGKITNAVGETREVITGQNPHVHILMNWHVPKQYFKGWAEQMESAWGQGFAHLERIHSPKAATGYLLKALGYMTKGNHTLDKDTGELISTQGWIRGNRYNISRSARAPGWEVLAEFEAERASQVLYEMGIEKQNEQHRIKQELEQARDNIKHDQAQLARWNRYHKVRPEVQKANVERLTRRLEREKARLEALQKQREKTEWGHRYQITFRTPEQTQAFIHHAIVNRGWRAKVVEHSKKGVRLAGAVVDWCKTKGRELNKAVVSEFWNQWRNLSNQAMWLDALYGFRAPPEVEPVNGMIPADWNWCEVAA
ncbi:hypothetical protein HMF8227_01443 [Saliniradius amylolyticus]|uniref:Uncharacterized protein n=1 Tax=Saliniradius amylolyticus TaxID=2183582 RepID=A0A2S2E2P4_9ALTE|nr:hypothetical protein [Saliniradius amylolyticus]AWL11918.1 hypothetical protein HMF8227_01443 [Saliniradius amylolyticus]